jgi:hypothetical protein
VERSLWLGWWSVLLYTPAKTFRGTQIWHTHGVQSLHSRMQTLHTMQRVSAANSQTLQGTSSGQAAPCRMGPVAQGTPLPAPLCGAVTLLRWDRPPKIQQHNAACALPHSSESCSPRHRRRRRHRRRPNLLLYGHRWTHPRLDQRPCRRLCSNHTPQQRCPAVLTHRPARPRGCPAPAGPHPVIQPSMRCSLDCGGQGGLHSCFECCRRAPAVQAGAVS